MFIVPTVALVDQQRRQFVKYLSNRSVLGLSGDQDSKLPLSELAPNQDIIVMTPQILDNALKEDIPSLSIFSLLIFDECHHTNKSHPYNQIMAHYIDELFAREGEDDINLPQVSKLVFMLNFNQRNFVLALKCK